MRLRHLLRELWLLVTGKLISLPLHFWAVMMLLGVVYMGAIFMVEVVEKNEALIGDPVIEQYWSTPPSAMHTLMQIATYEDWANISKYVDDRMPGMMIFFLEVPFGLGEGFLSRERMTHLVIPPTP